MKNLILLSITALIITSCEKEEPIIIEDFTSIYGHYEILMEIHDYNGCKPIDTLIPVSHDMEIKDIGHDTCSILKLSNKLIRIELDQEPDDPYYGELTPRGQEYENNIFTGFTLFDHKLTRANIWFDTDFSGAMISYGTQDSTQSETIRLVYKHI